MGDRRPGVHELVEHGARYLRRHPVVLHLILPDAVYPEHIDDVAFLDHHRARMARPGSSASKRASFSGLNRLALRWSIWIVTKPLPLLVGEQLLLAHLLHSPCPGRLYMPAGLTAGDIPSGGPSLGAFCGHKVLPAKFYEKLWYILSCAAAAAGGHQWPIDRRRRHRPSHGYGLIHHRTPPRRWRWR